MDESEFVSDDEREEAVLELREEFVGGRLTLEEFSERVDHAYGARTRAQLEATRDRLPSRHTAVRKPIRVSGALFGRAIRRGQLHIGRRARVVSIVADVDFDLRHARFQSEQVTISVAAVFGNADIYVPEGVAVSVSGALLGGRWRDWGGEPARPDAVIHIRIVGVLGTVDVWRVPGDMRGDYGEIQRELEERQKHLPA